MKAIAAVSFKIMLVVLTSLLFLSSQGVAGAEDEKLSENGRVYVMANEMKGNEIIEFWRTAEGGLIEMDRVPTGGLGSGPGPLPAAFGGPGPGPLPLNSQDSLVLTKNGRFLLAVNAGSNEVSVLAITRNGLRVVDKVPSGGEFPISIAHHDEFVYVLNAGGPKSFNPSPSRIAPSITGFVLDSAGKLHAIPNSTRITGSPISVPADVVFSPDGDLLIVSEVMTNSIDIFPVGQDGRIRERLNVSSAGPSPFGITVGRHQVLAVAEGHAIGTEGIGIPNQASVSTYRLTDDNTLEPISRGVPTTQTAGLWVRFTANGRFAYSSNLGSGTISSFSVSAHGELSLLAGVAATTGQGISLPLDMGITPNNRFLYVNAINFFAGAIVGYRINDDGSLTTVAAVNGLPISIEGIAAR